MNENNFFSDTSLHRKKSHRWVEMPMPSRNTLLRFAGWGVGRVAFSCWMGALSIIRNCAKAIIWAVNGVESATKKLLTIYDSLPTMGMPIVEMEATIGISSNDNQSIETVEILSQIEHKHCLIIGNTGSGKSTLAQWFASQCSRCKVYDPDAAPDEWNGLKVIGRGGDFEAINQAMQADLVELQSRIELRSKEGDRALFGYETCIIAEEFPALKDECELSADWLGKIARRGRKPKMFLVILSQSDTVTALGIEGDGAIRQNFGFIRLGKFAISHAKKLKNEALVNWFKNGKYRCLVEDYPCQLPDISTYLTPNRYLPQPQIPDLPLTLEVETTQDLQPPVSNEVVANQELKKAVLSLKKQGWSDTKIIEEILGKKGRHFAEGKRILSNILGIE